MPEPVFHRRSRWFAHLTLAVVAVLALAAVVEAWMTLTMAPQQAGRMLTYRLPLLIDLAAVWQMQRAFAGIGRGETFGAVLPRRLGRMGVALAAGGLVDVFGTPLLLRAEAGWRGPVADFEPAAITLGVVGFLLVFLAGLMREGERMRDELDSFL